MLADNLQVMAATIRRREEELLASEERLDLALDGANEGIWDWHLDSNRIDFDARYYMICGYAPDEFPASIAAWEKRVHPDDIEKTQTAVQRYLAGELETYDVEFRFLRKDGSYMWIQGRGKIVARNDQGDPIRFIGTHADITGRKQIEESLRITQFSVDRAAVGIYRIASDARILEANEKAARMIGYTTQELTAKFIFDIDPSVTEGNWGKIWQRLLDMGSDAFTTRHKTKDGRDIPVEIYSNLLEYGEQQFSIAFVRDITERKRSEEEVRRLRNYLSNIIDSMPSVLVGVDSQGRVTQWNRQAERVTGIRSSTAHRQPLADVFPRLAPEMNRIKTSILQRRVLSDLKVPFESQEGVRYEDVTIYPLVANGVEGAVIRVDDITERVRLEEMMIQSEKMLSVGGLAAGMAHEINNPLAGMVQTATVMHNRLTNADLPANRTAAEKTGITMEAIGAFMQERGITRMLETIRQSGSRAAEIVTNMLSFARKSENVVSSENLGTLLDRVVDLLQTDYDMKKHYDFKRIELVREYDDAVAVVPCEASKIQQVFMNILKNGAEAMAEAMDTANPPIFVLRVKDDADWVRVEIEDNGPGMDEVTRRRIFEPFFTTKPLGKGTGLGLSVSYFIVTEEHGGELGVQAAENGGTRFVIRLPRGAKNAA
jgi:PAS domain S-box-containing protein